MTNIYLVLGNAGGRQAPPPGAAVQDNGLSPVPNRKDGVELAYTFPLKLPTR